MASCPATQNFTPMDNPSSLTRSLFQAIGQWKARPCFFDRCQDWKPGTSYFTRMFSYCEWKHYYPREDRITSGRKAYVGDQLSLFMLSRRERDVQNTHHIADSQWELGRLWLYRLLRYKSACPCLYHTCRDQSSTCEWFHNIVTKRFEPICNIVTLSPLHNSINKNLFADIKIVY